MLQPVYVATLGTITAFLFILAIAMPFIQGDSSRARLKAIRMKREAFRDDLSTKKTHTVSLRDRLGKKSLSEKLSTKLKLSSFTNMDKLRNQLLIAGYRDPNTLPKFLLIRISAPILIVSYLIFTIYFGPLGKHVPVHLRPLAVLGGGFVGFMLPKIIVTNAATKRKTLLSRQFPDALDLLLVCVEAGLSIEQSFMRITEEIGDSIPEVSDEFALTGAELSFLGDRLSAYTNMVARTQMAEFKGLATALSQSEAYGTSVGGSLRVLSEDSRKMRTLAIEKKAGGLSAKMTIPMIMLILPCLFLIMMGPAVLAIVAVRHHH